jgi:ribosomal protein L7Ae-like RNA K-turn-binding protein
MEEHLVNVQAVDSRIAAIFDRPGPFVTAYLDATRSTENGPHEIDVRWRDLRKELEEDGADSASLDAMEARVTDDVGTPGPHGLVLVAAGGGLLHSDRLHVPPARSSGRVSALPHLLPYLAQRATDVAHIVVVADRTGADLLAVSASGGAEERSVQGGEQHPIHRTGRDEWSERHFQNRVENSWGSNAKDVAAEVTRLVREGSARLVVVAGDVRARNLIADDLSSALGAGVTVRSIDEGGRAAGSSTDALERAVHDQVLREAWRQRREVLEHLQQNLGRQEYAVAGAAEVAAALQMAQVDTVVLSDDPSSTLRAWIGPQPTEFGLDDADAVALGLDPIEHDRYDAALVRAVVGTGAKLLVTPGAHEYVADGVGALLRFDTPSS